MQDLLALKGIMARYFKIYFFLVIAFCCCYVAVVIVIVEF